MQWVEETADGLAGAAQQLPSKLLGLVATKRPGGREEGLLVTSNEIFQIKKYEHLGLHLPVTRHEVELLMGFDRSYVNGLEPENLSVLYQNVRAHAASWFDIEQRMKSVNVRLGNFAANFITSGKRLIDYIDTMDWADPFETSVRELNLEDIADLPAIPLSAGDLKKKKKLLIILTRVQQLIEQQQSEVAGVRRSLDVFSDTMVKDLVPQVSVKIGLARRNRLADSIEDLDEEIVRLAAEINQKREEYGQLVKTILLGFLLGLPGAFIMVNIFGEDAERVRQERNRLTEERDYKIAESTKKAPLMASMAKLLSHLEHIQLSLSDAKAATDNLRTVWDVMDAWIVSCVDKLQGISDQSSMAAFALEVELVLEPWNQIQEQSNTLAATFNRAINDWNSRVKA